MDDDAAIKRCQAGDADAFRHIVERYQAEAMGHALAILGNPTDACDAVQEGFVRAFRALDRFQAGRRFYPWFYTILRNCCLKLAAKRLPSTDWEDGMTGIMAPAEEPVERDGLLLNSALRQLPPEDREMITLKHLDGLSYEALAERLGVAPGTVMSRLYYARQRLRLLIERLRKEEL